MELSINPTHLPPLIRAANCCGTSCPVGLETSSRILEVYSALCAVSRILNANQALLGHFYTFWTDFRHF